MGLDAKSTQVYIRSNEINYQLNLVSKLIIPFIWQWETGQIHLGNVRDEKGINIGTFVGTYTSSGLGIEDNYQETSFLKIKLKDAKIFLHELAQAAYSQYQEITIKKRKNQYSRYKAIHLTDVEWTIK